MDFEPGATLLDLADLKEEFEEILGCSVDVLSSRGLKPRDEDIRREAVPLCPALTGIVCSTCRRRWAILSAIVERGRSAWDDGANPWEALRGG